VLPAWFCAGASARLPDSRFKLVKPKKPDQFQVRLAAGEVTYAADILLKDGEQKNFFYKELTPANIIAIRLAIYNQGKNSVTLRSIRSG